MNLFPFSPLEKDDLETSLKDRDTKRQKITFSTITKFLFFSNERKLFLPSFHRQMLQSCPVTWVFYDMVSLLLPYLLMSSLLAGIILENRQLLFLFIRRCMNYFFWFCIQGRLAKIKQCCRL